MPSAESKASGMLCCRADSCAFSGVRRDRAVTRQFCARAKPGISRFTACNPNPRIPKRIKENQVVAGESPAAFEFDFGFASIPARVCGTYLRGRVARGHTNHTTHPHHTNSFREH